MRLLAVCQDEHARFRTIRRNGVAGPCMVGAGLAPALDNDLTSRLCGLPSPGQWLNFAPMRLVLALDNGLTSRLWGARTGALRDLWYNLFITPRHLSSCLFVCVLLTPADRGYCFPVMQDAGNTARSGKRSALREDERSRKQRTYGMFTPNDILQATRQSTNLQSSVPPILRWSSTQPITIAAKSNEEISSWHITGDHVDGTSIYSA